MTDLGNRYAISALRKRRSEIAGEIAHLAVRTLRLKEQLAHVDATLRIFDPTSEPNNLPVSRSRKRVKLFRQGELGQIIRDALRAAGRPLGTHEIVTALIERQQLAESVRPALTPRVRGNLSYLERRGAITKVGKGQCCSWALNRTKYDDLTAKIT